MWDEARDWFEAHRTTLASAGIRLAARLAADGGLLCTYASGMVRLALPDPALPGGALRAGMIASLMGLSIDEVIWLFRAQLPRLVAHEIGHALRDEAGRMGSHPWPDPWAEEQAAERLACLLSRPHLDERTRAALATLLAGPARALGGLGEAVATHRLRDAAMRIPELSPLRGAIAPPAEAYRDLSTFLRVSVAWSWLDLRLDPEDTIDDYRRDLLLAA